MNNLAKWLSSLWRLQKLHDSFERKSGAAINGVRYSTSDFAKGLPYSEDGSSLDSVYPFLVYASKGCTRGRVGSTVRCDGSTGSLVPV